MVTKPFDLSRDQVILSDLLNDKKITVYMIFPLLWELWLVLISEAIDEGGKFNDKCLY